jgi:two-component system NarL family response regulator
MQAQPVATEKIRVMIADDHPVVCKGIAAIIQAERGMTVIGEASNGVQLVNMFREHVPDVTLIDLRMPVMGGVEAIRTIRKEYPAAGIIILTTYKGDEDIFRGLEAGAQGYLLKGMPNHELLDAIRNVHMGLRYLPPPVLESLANRPPNSDLSHRELQVLKLIVKGMSNKQIAEELGINQSTVKWHVNLMLARLNVADRTAAAVTALRRGIVEL